MSGNTSPCWITYDRSSPIAFCPGAIAYSAAIAGKPARMEMTRAAAANEHRRQTPTARLLVSDRSQIIALCSPPVGFFQHLRIQRTILTLLLAELSRFAIDRCARIIQHAYCWGMAVCHA